jgi:hypothetical protein
MNKLHPYALLAALLGLSQCKYNDPAPADQLPPATQTGANTFGCLVNGQPWTPQGFNGTPNYSATYDRTYHGGAFDVRAYRISDSGANREYIYVYADSVQGPGNYSLVNVKKAAPTYTAVPGCDYNRDPTTYRRGTLTLTRLDLQARIVSGTFEFTLAQPGCDTVKVTHGRFDYKL